MLCHWNNNLNRTHNWSNVLRRTLYAAFHKKNSKISWIVFFAHPPKGLHFVLWLRFYKYWELFKHFKAPSFGFHYENSHLPQKIINESNNGNVRYGATHTLECTISKGLVVCLSALLPHFTAYSLSSVHASQTNVEVGLDVLLKFKSLTMSWSVKVLFASKCPSRWFQSSTGLHPHVNVRGWLHLLRIPPWRSFGTNSLHVELLQPRAVRTSHTPIHLREIALQPVWQKFAHWEQIDL